MELKKLTNETIKLFGMNNISELSDKLKEICLNNRIEYFEKFENLVKDLNVDWLQKIYQYYEADRKDKGQDYTPTSLANLIGRLVATEDEKTILDMCAGSGALTIQKWSQNHNLSFICKELDGKVIPLLLFNLALRNIKAEVIRCDILQGEEYEKYILVKGERYSTVMEVKI